MKRDAWGPFFNLNLDENWLINFDVRIPTHSNSGVSRDSSKWHQDRWKSYWKYSIMKYNTMQYSTVTIKMQYNMIKYNTIP